MDAYTPARLAWEAQAEEASIGYQAEYDEYRRVHPGPTLKGYLIHLKGSRIPV